MKTELATSSYETQLTRLLRRHGAIKTKTHPSGTTGIRDSKQKAWFFYRWDSERKEFVADGSSSIFS